MKRRDFFSVAPAAAVAVVATPEPAETAPPALLDVIRELEDWQGWNAGCVLDASYYAAYLIRDALGLEQPHVALAATHLYFQARRWSDYQKSPGVERDRAAGRIYLPPKTTLTT